MGFIDGTNINIERPTGVAQRATYSGHKRKNCIKFQAISLPDSIIMHMYGPAEGRRHDITLFRRSGVEEDLRRALLVNEVQYYLYGYPEYVLRPYLQAGFKGVMTDEQREFNTAMYSVRIAVFQGNTSLPFRRVATSPFFKPVFPRADTCAPLACISLSNKRSCSRLNFWRDIAPTLLEVFSEFSVSMRFATASRAIASI